MKFLSKIFYPPLRSQVKKNLFLRTNRLTEKLNEVYSLIAEHQALSIKTNSSQIWLKGIFLNDCDWLCCLSPLGNILTGVGKGRESGALITRILLLHNEEFCICAAKSGSRLPLAFDHSQLFHSAVHRGSGICGSDLDQGSHLGVHLSCVSWAGTIDTQQEKNSSLLQG